ncbi:Clp protease N-terminal domain-containing protein [Streptomyces roseirectus]|uniref:Clp protease N-terminal domain-containing protein n=1 Tax=Streptomyces roseirectus TaxID=2768066 RepID=A0A7H0ITC2_9ACTN|nr:Clp protease N-terminal domain-containing protein [Streptomyces roseirectus]QNP76038.1 Clp protease N-terminal domain-containing protein [Streptomyces roseirectus]
MDDVAGFSAELAAAVAGARRRALRGADRQIDSAHLLHSLLEYDPEVRGAFGEGARVARVLGYLVQRSIGYGLRWQGGVEDSGPLPVVDGGSGALPVGEGSGPLPVVTVDGFSPLAAVAMGAARERARRRGVAPAQGVDLLAAVLADPGSRAVEVLARAGVDAGELLDRVEKGEVGDGDAWGCS